jgi:hypothetical protein
MATKPIPDGYRTATPYLIINGAAEAIEFYKRAFGATELLRVADAQGRVGHAEIKIGSVMSGRSRRTWKTCRAGGNAAPGRGRNEIIRHILRSPFVMF